MDLPWPLKFGVFMAPFHPVGDNPGLALERDLRTIRWLDELRWDEAWIGEHHSAGWETISSPEVFMGYAAAQTRSIMLGTGVVSLPYHNPYMVADRMALLDQLTRGRVMLGVGPGALPSDAYQLKLDPTRQRPQMDEALGVIQRLLRGETVTHESDWIQLRDARIQMPSFTKPHMPLFVASTLSPSGPTTAGKYGAGVISLSTFMPAEASVAQQWELAEQAAAEHGQQVDRRNWRLMMPIYIAETREEAYRDVSVNAYHFQYDYFDQTLGRPFQYPGKPEDFAEAMATTGGAIIGTHRTTPSSAIEEALGAERRLRRPPRPCARMGALAEDVPQLRALRALRRAPLPGLARFHPAGAGLGLDQPRRAEQQRGVRRGRRLQHPGERRTGDGARPRDPPGRGERLDDATCPCRMKFGVFLAPFHRLGENPTVSFERDMELIEHLDRLDFDEAWIGEHHSYARETIADPAIFIGAAAQRTKHIRLGTGVVSLPYHHPLMVADRMVQLDHMTRGRAMLGVGPGALTSDAYMMGIDPVTQRQRMNESLDAIMQLLRAEGPVNMTTDWFQLHDARLQLASYSEPHLPVSVAATFTPSGPTAAGTHGIGMLSVAGANGAGFENTWTWAEEAAQESGRPIDRRDWKVVVPVHVAETREQAIEDLREGYTNRAYVGDRKTPDYGQTPGTIGGPGLDVEQNIRDGHVIAGSPDPDTLAEAFEAIRLVQKSGGIGGILGLAHEWANHEKTLKSFDLWARHVAPRFQGQLQPLEENRDWIEDNIRDVWRGVPKAMAQAYIDAGKEVPDALKPKDEQQDAGS
ncbi:MAG: LLM class flavin-dependent oxidoreductase [Dehalococcoidia bacterium]|nr:LLM class flavin-dependent oxidoreductase [Dehalococcoidia bacterium]